MITRRVDQRVLLGIACLLCATALGGASAAEKGADPSSELTVREPALCFAPGTPPEVVQRALERQIRSSEHHSFSPSTAMKYELAFRWTSTASTGGYLRQGDPMTLTWGVVPDGTAIPGAASVGDGSAPSNLRSFLDGIYGSEAAWLAVFQQVFDRWGQLTGITYVHEANDDGAQLTSFGGQLGVRPDIRIGGHLIDGPYGILAYNYYPNNGDMVIDTGDTFFNDTSQSSVKLRNTAAHEHGHGLGLDHSCPMDQTKLMEPMLTTAFDGPQHDDILATNRFYGDRFEHSDSSATAASLGTFGSLTQTNLSIDDNADTDVYSLTVDGESALEVRVTPIGLTYLSGPQQTVAPYGCTAASSFDSLTIQDLQIRVLAPDGASVLAVVDANGVGQAETLSDVTLAGAGTYFVEVSGDTTNDAQMYEMNLTVSPSDLLFADGFESTDTNAWSSMVP
jgi:hypothetical protein